MNLLHDLFDSPDWHPFRIDFKRQIMTFARISRKAYQQYVFLGIESAQHRGEVFYEVRLDDVLLAAAGVPAAMKPVHYILHTAFCCSTLLARYFELLPCCFVVKEPRLLAELGLTPAESVAQWHDAFSLSLRLLSRTYAPDEIAIIKTHVPSNVLGERLLEQNNKATITFLINPLRDFLLATLKSDDRRGRVRYWNRHSAMLTACRIPQLATASPDDLSDPEAAAYWWLVNRFLCQELHSGHHRSRVLVLDGRRVADSPEHVLPAVMEKCGLPIDECRLEWLVTHPSARRHSKETSMFYDASSRRQEMEDLEFRYGKEADKAMEWAASLAMEHDICESFLPQLEASPLSS